MTESRLVSVDPETISLGQKMECEKFQFRNFSFAFTLKIILQVQQFLIFLLFSYYTNIRPSFNDKAGSFKLTS